MRGCKRVFVLMRRDIIKIDADENKLYMDFARREIQPLLHLLKIQDGARLMSLEWLSAETNTHQDHVIAHVVGATVLGHFVFDQAAHLLLDIGFIWTIFVDGEMGLVPQSMAIKELELDSDAQSELMADAQLLHDDGASAEGLLRIQPVPVGCLITEVNFCSRGDDERRIVIFGEEASLTITSSLLTGEIYIVTIEKEQDAA